ncbi:MAG: hypothetical protein KAJ14_09110, partial [Candidatus Omnitrophica bacterium]|nr:hypothetical protein [Candidatus Omnitrophota bacterium]
FNAAQTQDTLTNGKMPFGWDHEVAGGNVEFTDWYIAGDTGKSATVLSETLTVNYETLSVEETTAAISGITPATFSLEYGQNKNIDFTITNGTINPEFIHLIAESDVSEEVLFIVENNATEIQRIIEEGTFKFWHTTELTGQTVEYTNFTFVNADETKSIPYEGPVTVSYELEVDEINPVDTTLAYTQKFNEPTYVEVSPYELVYVTGTILNSDNISKVEGTIADIYYANNNSVMQENALILNAVQSQEALTDQKLTIVWLSENAGLNLTYTNIRSVGPSNTASPSASNSITVSYSLSDIQSMSVSLSAAAAENNTINIVTANVETVNTTNLSSVVDVERNQTLQNITNNTEVTLNASLGLEQMNISIQEENVLLVTLVEENQTVQNTLVVEELIAVSVDKAKEDVLIYSYMRGNLTVDVYETETGETREVVHGSPTHYTIKTDKKGNIKILYGQDDILLRVENRKIRGVTQIDYEQKDISLGDNALTKAETKENIFIGYRQFSQLYREKYLNGEETAEVAYTKHFGPYVDDYNKVYYRDYYYDSNNREIAWETKNLDGTIHIFDGTGIFKATNTKSTMMNDNGYAYYIDGDDSYKAKNPDGSIHLFGVNDSNATLWDDYLAQLENITSNVETATLKTGETFEVYSMTFKGGVITDKGYYIAPNQIFTLNVDGEAYSYIPTTRLGIWIMDRIDG